MAFGRSLDGLAGTTYLGKVIGVSPAKAYLDLSMSQLNVLEE